MSNQNDSLSNFIYGGRPELPDPLAPPRRRQQGQPIEHGLVLHDSGELRFNRFILHAESLEIPEDTTQQEWMDFGKIVLPMEQSTSWYVADWAVFAHRAWGTSYEAIAEHFKYAISSLWSYASVLENLNPLIRNQGLTFAHCRPLASIPQDEQIAWARAALEGKWTVEQLKARLARAYPEKSSKSKQVPATSVSGLKRKIRTIGQEIEAMSGELDDEDRVAVARLFRKLADKIDGKRS